MSELEADERLMERPILSGFESSGQTTALDHDFTILATLMEQQLAILQRMDQRFEAAGKCIQY
jgi:hypothetical protein